MKLTKNFNTGIIAGFVGGLFLMMSTAAGTVAAVSYLTLDGEITLKIETPRYIDIRNH